MAASAALEESSPSSIGRTRVSSSEALVISGGACPKEGSTGYTESDDRGYLAEFLGDSTPSP